MEDLNKKCSSCHKNEHILHNCPLFHYIPKKPYVIRNYLNSDPQLREKEFIRKKFRYKSFLNIQEIQKQAYFIVKNEKINESQTIENSNSDENQCSYDDLSPTLNEQPFNGIKKTRSFENPDKLNINTSDMNVPLQKTPKTNINPKQLSFIEEEESKNENSEISFEKKEVTKRKNFYDLKIQTKVRIQYL